MIALWSSKGGSGVSVTAAMLALAIHRAGRRALLVDLGVDQVAISGESVAPGAGLGEWLATPTADATALARLANDFHAYDLVTSGVVTVVASPERLMSLDANCVVDVGLVPSADSIGAQVVAHATLSLLVVRPCYLALRRASALAIRADGVVVIREPGRSLSSGDVADVLQASVVMELGLDPAIARAVDAGRLSHKAFRLPRSVEKYAAGLGARGEVDHVR